MDNPLVWAALITLAGTALTALSGLIGGIFYLFRRDPMGARNGAFVQMAEALEKVAQASNDDRHAFLATLEKVEKRAETRADANEKRADERHSATMGYIEKLADVMAPRTPR